MTEPCTLCGQIDHGQTGEYPCPGCGLPLTWDDEPSLQALWQLLDPIKDYRPRAKLREIAIELKQMDGEHWMAGEMLERGCIFLDAWQVT